MTARIYFIVGIAIILIIAILGTIYSLNSGIIPWNNNATSVPIQGSGPSIALKNIDDTGYYSGSANSNFAVLVARLDKFGQENGNYYIFVSIPGKSKKIQISNGSSINISYYKDKTKDIFPDSNQAQLISIKNAKDLTSLLNRLVGKNIIINFFLDSPINSKLLPNSVLKCNSQNLSDSTNLFSASCIPFTQIISSYDP